MSFKVLSSAVELTALKVTISFLSRSFWPSFQILQIFQSHKHLHTQLTLGIANFLDLTGPTHMLKYPFGQGIDHQGEFCP